MAMMQLAQDLKEFLRLLNSHQVEYLLIGGYAVGYFGYPRATGDMDIWIAVHPQNARRLVTVLHEFGFTIPEVNEQLFLQTNKIFRMGNAPLRIELLTDISGVQFDECYQNRIKDEIDGVPVTIIGFEDLLKNKQASARHKDLDDAARLLQIRAKRADNRNGALNLG